jgi:hypothetical protein
VKGDNSDVFDHLRKTNIMDGVTGNAYRLLGGIRHSQSFNDISSLSSLRNNQWRLLNKVR